MKLVYIFFISILIISCDNAKETNEDDKRATPENDSVYKHLEELYSKQNYKQAERIIDTLKPKSQDDLAFYTLKAKIKYNCQHFSETIHAINKALEINPNNSTLLFLKSSSYMALNYTDSALIFLTKAINLDSSNTGYISARIRMYENMKIPVLQLDDINHLIRINSNNIEYKFALYNFKYHNGDTITAVNGFKDALKEFPNNVTALQALGIIAFERGNKKEAKDYLQRSIDIEPTDGLIFLYMASILADEKKKDKSCDCLLKAVELGDQNALKHIYKCEEYLKKKGVPAKTQGNSKNSTDI